jgi:hypothetical protein
MIIPAEGAILERVLDTAHSISSEGLSRHAYGQCDAAQMRTAWGRRRRRRFALAEGGDVLAGATQYDLSAVLDQQPVRVCGIAQILPQPAPAAGGPARELVDGLLEQAARGGAALALLFSDMNDEQQVAGFDAVPMTDVEIGVAEPPRRGAPMTLLRGGEERDLAAIVAMGRIRAEPFRFHLDRDVEFEQYAITRKRLLAGLGTAGARQLHFFIAEEGITAAARTSSSASSVARGRLRSAATAIPPVRESAPFSRRSSHVNPSSAARRSTPGSLAALSLHR